MKEINYNEIVNAVSKMCIESNLILPDDTELAMKNAEKNEISENGKIILQRCLENSLIAKKDKIPLCQDTGLAVFFVNYGVNAKITGGRSSNIKDAVNDGVAEGYKKGFLRKSILTDPVFDRKNTENNLPAIIHLEMVEGDSIEISLAPKGGGAENMSRLKMLVPSDGRQGIVDFVVESVAVAGGNPCPPIILGIGIGGNFEMAAVLAKKALFWPLDKKNPDERYRLLEEEILEKVNDLGIGPQGIGGSMTALSAHIEWMPCHLASLPVALNINCHQHRHMRIIL